MNRPLYLKDYIGQEHIKKQISIFISSAKERKDTLDHVLLSGPPGLGKTTLANIIANELKANITVTTGAVLTKKADLAGILTNLEEGDILFIDEIHRISKPVEELLYTAMEDFAIDIILGKNRAARTIRIDLPKFTLIGATTKAGMLSTPLLSRFGIILNFDFYDLNSLIKILKIEANKAGVLIDKKALEEIAKRSRGTPRIAKRLFKRVYDFAVVNKVNKIDIELVKHAFDLIGIDEYGLSFKDRQYLKILVYRFENKPVGIKTISSILHEEEDVIENVIEPYLIRIGFIEKTPRGRIITQKGLQYIKEREYERNI